LGRWLNVFADESAVKRESIVLKFGRVRAALESAERAALSAYDEEVRRVVKSCEVECESVEVLSQQLSACVLAYGGGVTACENVDDSLCVDKAGSVGVRSVNVALCEEGFCELLERCWSLVSVSSGDNDEEALRVAEAEGSIYDRVSVDGGCCVMPSDCDDVLLCLLLQLIPVISGCRASKQERIHALNCLIFEKSMRFYPGAKVTCCCGCVPLNLLVLTSFRRHSLIAA
jgi:hypothetical protein